MDTWQILPTYFLILKTILFLLSSPAATNNLLEVNSADRLSCKDLNELGHTLNGIYLVKIRSSTSSNQSKMVTNAVFCDFMEDELPSSSFYSIKQSSLGYVDVKSEEESTKNSSRIYGISTFKLGTDPALQMVCFILIVKFLMLENGFELSFLEIYLRVNGARIGQSLAGSGFFSAPVTMQTYLKLRKGDRVDLWKSYGSLNPICTFYCHHFTGFLIEED